MSNKHISELNPDELLDRYEEQVIWEHDQRYDLEAWPEFDATAYRDEIIRRIHES